MPLSRVLPRERYSSTSLWVSWMNALPLSNATFAATTRHGWLLYDGSKGQSCAAESRLRVRIDIQRGILKRAPLGTSS